MKAKTESKKTSDAVTILDRMAGGNAELRRLTEEARTNAAVAQLIYSARTKAGLSQADLAEKLGTKQSVISRLEDADYEGHSLSMLQRIAAALGQYMEIRFLPPVEKVEQPILDMPLLGPQFVNAIPQIIRRRTPEFVAKLSQQFNAGTAIRPGPLVAVQEFR